MTSPTYDGGNAFSTYDTSTPTPVPASGGVFTPDIATYATRSPYITAAEFTEAGTGVDVSQLVPAGSAAANTAALLRVIARASAWADSLTYKVLAATLDTQAGRYMVRDGICRVPVKYSPVIEVTAISTGCTGWDLAPLTDLSQVAIVPPKVVEFALPCQSGRRFVSLQYVNGYACTTLSGSAAVGDTQLTLTSNLGLYPGLVLTVDDGANTEQVQVAASYTPGATGPVPLASAVVNAHAAGVAASAMPQDIKQAVVLLTACLIKTRGNEAFVMGSIGAEPTVTSTEAGGSEDFEMADDLLTPYRRAA